MDEKIGRPVPRADLLEIGLRLQQALSPAAIAGAADAMGVALRTMRKYTNGETVPPLDLLMWVADEHDISVEWLLTGRGQMRASDSVGALLRTASLTELCKALQDRLAIVQEMDPADACPYPACPLVELIEAKLRGNPAEQGQQTRGEADSSSESGAQQHSSRRK